MDTDFLAFNTIFSVIQCSSVARQPTLAVHSQEFASERACRNALAEMKKVNVGELTLRGICVSKE